jgi:AcrR family transcriptional regulator
MRTPDRLSAEASAMLSRIIDEATRLFVAGGYRGISMREIAEAVGISKAGLYYHFRDKEDLFIAILTAHLAGVEWIIRGACSEDATAREQVTRLIRGILSLPPNQRAVIRLATQEMVHVSQAARLGFEGIYQQRFLGRIEAILQGGIERGELRRVNVQLATWLLLGMAYPFFSPSHPLGETDQTVDLMIAVFFDGLSEPMQREA